MCSSKECQDRRAGVMCQASKDVLATWRAAQVRLELCSATSHQVLKHSLTTCAGAGCLL